MPRLMTSLLVGAAAALAATGAGVQAAAVGGAGADDQESAARQSATEDGDRVICRSRQRAASRMRTSRVCRTRAEWEQVARTQSLEDAADTLEIIGTKISTGDTGGLPQ